MPVGYEGPPKELNDWGGYANSLVSLDYNITQTTGSIVSGTDDTGNHADDDTTLINLPFPVQFYDKRFSSMNVSSNGNIQFVSTNSTYLSEKLPASDMNYLIAPLWSDLYDGEEADGQGIFTSVSGVYPSRILNVDFRMVPCCPFGAPTMFFEVRLHEDTPNFEIIYGAQVYPVGNPITIGCQRDKGSRFTQFYYSLDGSDNPVVDGLQLNFVRV